MCSVYAESINLLQQRYHSAMFRHLYVNKFITESLPCVMLASKLAKSAPIGEDKPGLFQPYSNFFPFLLIRISFFCCFFLFVCLLCFFFCVFFFNFIFILYQHTNRSLWNVHMYDKENINYSTRPLKSSSLGSLNL
jgi:hypothetical protein